MAALWETMAFTFRTLSTRRQQNTAVYLIFQIFILLAPLCAFILFLVHGRPTNAIEQGLTRLTIWCWAG